MTDTAQLLPILKRVPIFATLDEGMHMQIIGKISYKRYEPNQIFFHEGDTGNAMYIIKNGQAAVYHEPKELGYPEQIIATLKDNDFFGEMALVSSDPRNASVKAVAQCDVFVLSKSDFDILIGENPDMANKISTTYFERFKENQK
ncbi:MAG: cyclic nucleotide-binding domain-containing protein [Patescibacteria group bacterium]|nr:cyclic nucleotide-binding domain-containing protein [Patescibacteria group bacterium]